MQNTKYFLPYRRLWLKIEHQTTCLLQSTLYIPISRNYFLTSFLAACTTYECRRQMIFTICSSLPTHICVYICKIIHKTSFLHFRNLKNFCKKLSFHKEHVIYSTHLIKQHGNNLFVKDYGLMLRQKKHSIKKIKFSRQLPFVQLTDLYNIETTVLKINIVQLTEL